MKTLTIIDLEIKNFKGIKSFALNTDGARIQVSGKNGTGKTSIHDAFTWLMFGKDSNDRADFQLKPVDPAGNEIHNLDTEVTAALDISGDHIILKKRFFEKWTKRRGASRAEFTGHQTDHFIDGVPVKKGEFDARVADIVDPAVFKLVTSPAEFNRLHWQDRRKILIDMCGDVSDADVIKGNDALSGLADILGKRAIDDHMKAVKAQQRDINKELEQIPVRIDELTGTLAEIAEPDTKAKDRLEKQLALEKEKLDSVRYNERLSQKRIEANTIRAKIQEARHQAKTGIDAEAQHIINELNQLAAKKQAAKNEIEQLRHDIGRDEKRNGVAMAAMDQLRKDWHRVNEKVTEAEDTCPACGQNLPADQVQGARDTSNQIKANHLAAIQKEGWLIKEAVEGRLADIQKAMGREKDLLGQIVDIEKQISATADTMPAEPASDTGELDKQLSGVMSEIEALENGKGIQEKDLLVTIDEIVRKLSDIAAAEAGVKASEKTRARIVDLEKQEKSLADAYERLAEQVYLIEQFIVEKVRHLEERINGQFEMATFKMFKEQINSGIVECCETLHCGVPYNSGLNNGARINTGIDIINTLSGHYGFQGPIFVDNSEAVNQLIATPAQVIAMAVTDDPAIVIEILSETEEAAA